MAMRDLVTGGAACAVPGSSSSNPFGALANTLIGSSSKTQERLKEIPTSVTTPSDGNFGVGVQEPLATLPGSEIDHPFQPNLQGSEFLQGFRTADQNSFADVWDGIQRPQLPHSNFPLDNSQLQPELNGPPQRVLSNFLHSFVNSSHGGIPFRPASLPALGLSQGEKQCIRDRSTIMARHFFADKNEDFINAQVNALLCSLDIDADIRARGPMPGRLPELEDYWNESQGIKTMPQVADSWAAEFGQRHMNQDTNAWVRSFEQQNGVNGWASEFEHEQSQLGMIDQMRGANIPSLAAMEQTRMLAHTLAQNRDPKFQGKNLFRKGLLSEAVLALEAEVIKEALRMLRVGDYWGMTGLYSGYYVASLGGNDPKGQIMHGQYLRISLSCASRNDMIEGLGRLTNLDVLQKEVPTL
nr:peroxisome biogenesis protein 5 [Ipomoea batatas]